MSTLARSSAGVLAACLLVLLGCTQQAHAEPAQPSADALIVSVGDIQKISGADDLHSSELSDLHQPKNLADWSDLSPECQQVFAMESVFGAGWKQFRSVAYVGAANRGVTQTIAVYGSSADAAAALDRIAVADRRCVGTSGKISQYTVTQNAPSHLTLSWHDAVEVYEAKGAVLVNVYSVHFSNAGEISTDVTNAITGRIPA